MMRTLNALWICALALGAARADDGVRHLYIQAAAAAEKCVGVSLTDAQAAKLAAVIGEAGYGPVTPEDITAGLAAARAAGPVNCADLYTQIHLQFFERTIRPKLQPAVPPRGSDAPPKPVQTFQFHRTV
jgi:hypothetical protein